MTGQRGYILDRERIPQKSSGRRYYRQDLEMMSVYQLREIAQQEKLVTGIVNPLDKELLMHVILRYRGAEKALMIREYQPEAYKELEEIFLKLNFQQRKSLVPDCRARLEIYRGLAVDYYDNITIGFRPELVGTNAFVVDGENRLCCVFNVEMKGNDESCLYLRKEAELPCREAVNKNYQLVFVTRETSEQIFHFYHGDVDVIPTNVPAGCVPLLDFTICEPEVLKTPAAIDFGTSNTVAGALCLSDVEDIRNHGIYKETVKYAVFYDMMHDAAEREMVPTVIGVYSLEDPKRPEYRFGYEAQELSATSHSDESVCLFYDIKRWIVDYEREEELTDKVGRRIYVKRKVLLREFFLYMIHALENRIKMRIRNIHISNPVKQKYKFQRLFEEILPEYVIEKKDMVDEGVSVLYNTISDLIAKDAVPKNQRCNALIIDCGGGTTDISSCSFKVNNQRVSYKIDIETGYENGSTDFGGNNLTFRIMQLLKLRLVESLNFLYLKRQEFGRWKIRNEYYGKKVFFGAREHQLASQIPSVKDLLKNFDREIFRFVDENGTAPMYDPFERAYAQAEEILPTRFKEWETRNRSEYFKVRNNFYYLFSCAENLKRKLFEDACVLRVMFSVESNHAEQGKNWDIYRKKAMEFDDVIRIPFDKWKLSIHNENGLIELYELPDLSFNIFEVNMLLAPDIYSILHRFMNPLYESGDLEDYSIIKLSGQSCKVDFFRTSLSEFVPGKAIKARRRSDDAGSSNELKMSCIDGVLKYLRDKKFGYADVTIESRVPNLPYILSGFTHNGTEKFMIHGFKNIHHGVLSRNMDDLTLELFLKAEDGKLRHQFTYYCTIDEFQPKTQEELEAVYGENIPQEDTDNIVDREVKFFVWAEPKEWGFLVVPIYRNGELLMAGKEQFFSFEDDAWVQNFFDGMK